MTTWQPGTDNTSLTNGRIRLWQLDGGSHRDRAVEYLQALEDVADAAESLSPHEGDELGQALQRLPELRR
jgi:hypothetical protein